MTTFILLAALLSIVAVVLLSRPLWRPGKIEAGASREALNTAIFRSEISELEKEKAEGSLSDADFTQARDELQRRLLEDTASDGGQEAGKGGHQRALWVVRAAVPVVAAGLYFLLGTPNGVLPEAQRAQAEQHLMEGMVAALAKKLEKNPDNPEGWRMLARSYAAIGRFADALKAFEHLGSAVDQDAQLLAEKADLTIAASQTFSGEPQQLVERALKLDPNNLTALWLSGRIAIETGKPAEAVRQWEMAQSLLPPGSEDAQALEESIGQARTMAGMAKAAPVKKAEPAKKASASNAAASAGIGVSGRVELAAALKAQMKPDQLLWIMARPTDGSRMPVAVIRTKAGELPMNFSLDDSNSLSPERKLSSLPAVIVEARISLKGDVVPTTGDLMSKPTEFKVGSKGVKVVIDQVRP